MKSLIISGENIFEKEYSGKIPIIIIFKKSSRNDNFMKISQILPQLPTT
jgi:hypothetical protein